MRAALAVRQGSQVQAGYRGSGSPALVLLGARNRLAKFVWAPSFLQSEATLKLEAEGWASITVNLGAGVQTALVDGVEVIDLSGNFIQWKATLTVHGTKGEELVESLLFTPELVEPTLANTGIPEGLAGDLRAPVELTEITHIALEALVAASSKGTTFSNYHVTGGRYRITASKEPIFKCCRFEKSLRLESGGVYYPCTTIDCDLNGGEEDMALNPGNTWHKNIRCQIHNGDDIIRTSFRRPTNDNEFLHSYAFDTFTTEGHCDIVQWQNASGEKVDGWGGRFVGVRLQGTNLSGKNVNSLQELGSAWEPEDRIRALFDHCFYNSPDGEFYAFNGPAAPAAQSGDILHRNGKVGLATGKTALLRTLSMAGMGWEGMTWAETGTTADGRSVVAGQPVPFTGG